MSAILTSPLLSFSLSLSLPFETPTQTTPEISSILSLDKNARFFYLRFRVSKKIYRVDKYIFGNYKIRKEIAKKDREGAHRSRYSFNRGIRAFLSHAARQMGM